MTAAEAISCGAVRGESHAETIRLAAARLNIDPARAFAAFAKLGRQVANDIAREVMAAAGRGPSTTDAWGRWIEQINTESLRKIVDRAESEAA